MSQLKSRFLRVGGSSWEPKIDEKRFEEKINNHSDEVRAERSEKKREEEPWKKIAKKINKNRQQSIVKYGVPWPPQSSEFTEARKTSRFFNENKIVEGNLDNFKIADSKNHDQRRRESLHIYEGLRRAVQNHS